VRKRRVDFFFHRINASPEGGEGKKGKKEEKVLTLGEMSIDHLAPWQLRKKKKRRPAFLVGIGHLRIGVAADASFFSSRNSRAGLRKREKGRKKKGNDCTRSL